MRHLILRLEAPLMAFGGETIDNYGVIRPFPAASMLTGLLANALGWRRTEREQHQRLQDRLVFAVRIDREPRGGLRLRDFQTAQLGAADKGWTTRGEPEGRDGGPTTYDSPHLRHRDYWADALVTVALRLTLDPATESETLTLGDLEAALQEPARPLFLGRKPCLPSGPLLAGEVESDTSLAALLSWPMLPDAGASPRIRLLWSAHEDTQGVEAVRTYALTDQRDWLSGLHGGGRWVCEGALDRGGFRAPAQQEGQP